MHPKRLEQAQQLAGAAATLGGSTVKFIKSAIFSGIGTQALPKVLFPALAMTAVTSSAIGLCAAKDKKDFGVKLLGLVTSGGMYAAVFYLEGPVQVFMFTAALGGRAAASVIEAAYKYEKNGKLTKMDRVSIAADLSEALTIIPNLYIGGTGNVFELAKVGAVTATQQGFAWAASACSSIGSAIGLFKTANAVDELATDCKKPLPTRGQLFVDQARQEGWLEGAYTASLADRNDDENPQASSPRSLRSPR